MRTWSVRLGLTALLVVLGLSMETGRARACLCNSPTFAEQLVRADLIFRGTVVRSMERECGTAWEFDVSTVWKGSPSATVVVDVYGACSNCPHLKFLRGIEYLVYAYETRDYELRRDLHPETHEFEFQERTYWLTSFCTRTARITGAHEDLDALGGTGLSPWGVRLLAAEVVALVGAGIVTLRRRSKRPLA